MSRLNSSEEERINNLKKLHIGKLKAHEPLNEELLKEYFSQFGEVVNLNIPKESKPENEPAPLKGYGFVEFATLEAAKKCVRTKSHTFADKELHVHRSIPKDLLLILNDAKREGEVKVFLRNKENFTEEQLRDFFTNHPKLPMTPKSVTVPKDPNQDKPKGYAILEFPDEDDCICLVTVVKLKIEKEGGQQKELYPSFYVKNNNRRFRGYGGYGYGRGWNQGYGGDYYGGDYYSDFDDYYHGGYGGYGNYGGYGGYDQGYGSGYGGGGYGGRRYGGGGGRPYSGGGGGRGGRRGGDFA